MSEENGLTHASIAFSDKNGKKPKILTKTASQRSNSRLSKKELSLLPIQDSSKPVNRFYFTERIA